MKDAICKCGHVKSLHWQQLFDCLIEGCLCTSFETAESPVAAAPALPEPTPCKECCGSGHTFTGRHYRGNDVNEPCKSCNGTGRRVAETMEAHRFNPGRSGNSCLFRDKEFICTGSEQNPRHAPALPEVAPEFTDAQIIANLRQQVIWLESSLAAAKGGGETAEDAFRRGFFEGVQAQWIQPNRVPPVPPYTPPDNKGDGTQHDSSTCRMNNCPACQQESNIEGIR